MEAASPIMDMKTLSEIDISNKKMIDIKSFNISLDNKEFQFEFGKSENKKYIIFKMEEKNNIMNNTHYILYLDINDFYSLNLLFKLYQTIDDIYNFLLEIIIGQKYSFISNENIITLVLKFPMPGGKIIDINFELKKKRIAQENLMQNLYSKLEELLNENKKMKNDQDIIKKELINKNKELENLKNDINYLKQENILIKNNLKKIENYLFNKKEKEENNNFFHLNNSSILKSDNEKNKILEWISNQGKIKGITLLYKASRDGDEGRKFYTLCTNKGCTISFIKTLKGRRFGGFTKAEWKNTQTIIEDNNAFLFSLDNMEKYAILKSQFAIGCDPDKFFLIYGNNCDGKGIYLKSGFFNNKIVCREDHSTKVYDVPSNYCLSGENNFYVAEVEVYNLEFEK